LGQTASLRPEAHSQPCVVICCRQIACLIKIAQK
jgi:hypothetical protein